jgi:hypothetical protein
MRPFCISTNVSEQGSDLQNFLRQIRKLFVTFGLYILKFLILKVVFEADIIKG